MDIASIREEYARASLDEKDAAPDPFAQFTQWFDAALKADIPLPNAMTLATVSKTGEPSARIVLLKECDNQGFVFFTNYDSRKGRELALNKQAALLFFWSALERQIRIEGRIEKVMARESDEYFVTRPLGSRLGAVASPQSEVLPGREALQARYDEAERLYGAQPPRPPHWGGYRLIPTALEFWQGRTSRLHDRLHYRLGGDGGWQIERLAP